MSASHADDLALLRYRFDLLEGTEAEEVSRHLRTCTQCATRFAHLGQGLEILDRYDLESELDEAVAERVLERVKELQKKQEAEQAQAGAARLHLCLRRGGAAVAGAPAGRGGDLQHGRRPRGGAGLAAFGVSRARCDGAAVPA